MKRIYFDHNATTPLEPRVKEALLPFLTENFGNPSSIHYQGQKARMAVEEARSAVARLLGADPGEIIFTGGGTEADNGAIFGAVFKVPDSRKAHVITSPVEHPAVFETCKYLEKSGVAVTYLPVDGSGRIDPGDVKKAIKPETGLITLMLANNETGTLHPVEEVVPIAKEAGVPLHTDAVQCVGKMPLSIERLPVDLLSISSHKFYGPKGVGALYIRKGQKINPFIHGGHQERGRRGGTENVPSIVGMGRAAELVFEEGEEWGRRMGEVREYLENSLFSNLDNVVLNGHPDHRLPNTINLSFPDLEGESLTMNLDLEGIGVSTGSACTSGTVYPSHVLLAMGLTEERAHSALRISLGKENTKEEADLFLEKIRTIVEKLRKLSPRYTRKY
jgi:cysteine desulfurase